MRRGWLLLLCVTLLVWRPLDFAIEFPSTLSSLGRRGLPAMMELLFHGVGGGAGGRRGSSALGRAALGSSAGSVGASSRQSPPRFNRSTGRHCSTRAYTLPVMSRGVSCCSCARRCSSGGRSISRSSFHRRCRRSACGALPGVIELLFHGAVAALAVAAVRALSNAHAVRAVCWLAPRWSRQPLPRSSRSTGRSCRTRRCPATSCRSRYSAIVVAGCWLLYLRRARRGAESILGPSTARARSFRSPRPTRAADAPRPRRRAAACDR